MPLSLLTCCFFFYEFDLIRSLFFSSLTLTLTSCISFISAMSIEHEHDLLKTAKMRSGRKKKCEKQLNRKEYYAQKVCVTIFKTIILTYKMLIIVQHSKHVPKYRADDVEAWSEY